MEENMPPANILIKPASSSCNLRCKYCFYHSLSESRTVSSFGIMTGELSLKLIERAYEYASGFCTFAFQGGEPTLAGIDFFKNFVLSAKKLKPKNLQVNFALQTNGMLINEEWAIFLNDNNFLVGLSLDGPKDINDLNRIDAKSGGSFNKIMNTVDLFNRYKVEYNILSVVSNKVAKHVTKIYNFFKKNGFKYLQFIQCLDPLGEEAGGHIYSLTPEMYSEFLKTLFDLWYKDITSNNMISIRYFDNLVTMVMGYPPEACGMSGRCACAFTVEADGSVYPCDFYVTDALRLGNIIDSSLAEMESGKIAKEFIDVSLHVDEKCRQCKWFNICRGGCRRTREPFVDGRPSLNYYCQSYYDFFEYSYDRILYLSRLFRK
jgi:uncharacterized protein